MSAEDKQPARTSHWQAGLVIGVLLLIVVVVAVRLIGDRPDAALRGLQDDLIASYQPQGGQLVSTFEQNADRSDFLGKPVQARFVRTFKLAAGADAHRQIRSALSAARAAGWQIEEGHEDGGVEFMGSLFVHGDKPLPSGEIKQLSIEVTTAASSVGSGRVPPPAMRISLESPEIDSR